MNHATMAAAGQPSHQAVPLARERAALYAWFATVYAEEMPEERIVGQGMALRAHFLRGEDVYHRGQRFLRHARCS